MQTVHRITRDRLVNASYLERFIRVFALAVIVAASFALSLLWATTVPIFQSPDEPAHFAYAHALATARHVLRARDGEPSVDPEIAAFTRAMNTQRIAFHAREAVSPAYGSRAYFAATDRAVPRLPDDYFARPGHRVPELLVVYPVGAYAVIGAAIAVLQSAFHAGIVEQLFGARFFCCGLFVIGLVFWYRTFAALPLHWTTSLGLTAFMGLFPLSSFVASYVQPDNLVFALISPLLWLSLRLRNRDLRLRTVGGYGACLGLLVLTKFHFALCVAIPTLPIVVLAAWKSRIGPARAWLWAAAVGLPAAAALRLHQYISSGRAQPYFNGPHALSSGVLGAFAGGLQAGSSYTLNAFATAYFNYFLHGDTARSYWAIFGWLDTRVTFFNAAVTTVVLSVIKVGTNLVIVLVLVLMVRNARRLQRIARRRSWRSAGELLARNPVFNAYVVFTLFMLLLFVTSGDTFGAQGRDWYPFEGSAFAMLLVYAPKALGKRRFRNVATGLAAVFLAVYCSVGSAYCIAAVQQRYYHPMNCPTAQRRSISGLPAVVPIPAARR